MCVNVIIIIWADRDTVRGGNFNKKELALSDRRTSLIGQSLLVDSYCFFHTDWTEFVLAVLENSVLPMG